MRRNIKIDETDNRYGRWSVVAPAESKRKGVACWLCRCDCGTERVVTGNSLRNGSSRSCGCDVSPNRDLTDQEFGNWKVLGRAEGLTRARLALWDCRCVCGTERAVRGSSLRSGTSQSCGCLLRTAPTKYKPKRLTDEERQQRQNERALQQSYENDQRRLGKVPLPLAYLSWAEVRLLDFVPVVAPADFRLPADWPMFDVRPFFITSGEAVVKARYALGQFKQKADRIGELVAAAPSESATRYQRAAWRAITQLDRLVDLLVEARGQELWLECWQERGLQISPRRPRAHDEAA